MPPGISLLVWKYKLHFEKSGKRGKQTKVCVCVCVCVRAHLALTQNIYVLHKESITANFAALV